MTPERNDEKKVLAIAIMRDGKVVGKLIPGKEPVRMGTGYNNNIVVEGAGLPDTMVLITPGEDSETWLLRLAENMDATVESSDGATLKFSDLRDLGIFPLDPDNFYLLNIKYQDQGQISAGPFVIHFGFIAPPKVARPQEKKEKKLRAEKAPPEREQKKDDRILKIVVEDPDGKTELIPNAGLMTVGEAEYNTVTARNIGLPRIHTLLEPHEGKYMMRLIPGIKGGVEVKGSVIPFHTLIERNLMQQEKPGEPYVWIFDKNVTGVFTLGNKEVFFSFTEPAAVQKKDEARPDIPRKKYVAAEYDWENFATRPHEGIAMKGHREESNRIAIILGLGLAIALLSGAVLDRFVTVVHETKEQKLRSAPTARVATLASQNRQTQGIGEEIVTDMNIGEETVAVGSGGGGPAGSGGGTQGGVSDGQAAGQAVLQSIGFAAYGTGGTGGSAGIATDLQAAASSGAGLVSGGGGEAVIAGAGGGGSGGISGLVGEGGGPSASIEGVSSSEVEAVHRAAEVSFSTHSSSTEIGVQGRTMNDIRRKINTINMRVKRAYEDLLRTNPTAGGTINVSFSITPSGSVTGISISAGGSLSSLEPSVRAAVQSLNFGPSSEQVDDIPMTVPINLVPPE
ncbi:MAG: hypothetical protein JXA64_02990 [Candidatus Fermentibacteraceae bacterium]|nr:hypothetical protein [Candidatus Fermentibacteraceae bacterium]MBN2608056.1 hypothetical protein [Candidatus Fermentibacteraceae bacterium]